MATQEAYFVGRTEVRCPVQQCQLPVLLLAWLARARWWGQHSSLATPTCCRCRACPGRAAAAAGLGEHHPGPAPEQGGGHGVRSSRVPAAGRPAPRRGAHAQGGPLLAAPHARLGGALRPHRGSAHPPARPPACPRCRVHRWTTMPAANTNTSTTTRCCKRHSTSWALRRWARAAAAAAALHQRLGPARRTEPSAALRALPDLTPRPTPPPPPLCSTWRWAS